MNVTCPACGTSLPAGFKFCGNCGQKIEAAPSAPAPAPAPAPSRDERRDVSVMFADVSGFTAMSEKLDPEQVHAIMNACFEGLGAAIQAEGGHIDKYIGDNVMALFGAPIAHEDDPRRAGRAALGMQTFLGEFAEKYRERTGVTFRMRIGIHCGLVLAGNVGASVRRDYSVMGDAVNLASRLESNARPGSILVSQEFMRRTRGVFAFGPVSDLKVKGKAEHVQAYELLRELTEIEAGADPQAELPFVGRRELIDEIVARWAERSRAASWIRVSGPSGIGKTRLVEAAAAEARVRLLRVTARKSTKQRPLALVRRIVQSVTAAVATHSGAPESFQVFAEGLQPVAEGLDAHLGALWYLAAPDHIRVPAPDPDPQTLRRTLQYGFARLLSNVTRLDPNAVIFLDDYDFGDPTSAELLEHLPDAGSPPPVIATVKTKSGNHWHDIDVPPLPTMEVEELLARLEHARVLPSGLRSDLIDRAGGVPLYVEEMILKLLDEGVIHHTPEGWTCEPQASSAMLPESLFGALVARVDALDRPLRRLLLECAVQGVEFSAEVATEVSRTTGGTPQEVGARVLDLSGQHLIDPVPYRPAYWNFRQSLMQAACYETLLLSERKQLHHQTALAIAVVAGGARFVSPTVLAHHFESAEAWLESAAANLRAGERSAEIFANDEAAARYARAIEQAERAGGGEAAAIAIEAHDGAARLHLRIGAYDEVERLARRLLELATDSHGRARGHRHFALACFHTGRTEEAREHLLRGLSELGDQPDSMLLQALASELCFDIAHLELRAARLTPALEYAAKSRARRNPSDQAAGIRIDILDGRLAHTQGRFEDAVAHYTRAFEAANRLGSVSEQARACNYMGDASRDIGDYEKALRFFERALAMWERIGDAEGVAGAHNNLANLAMSRGDLALARHHHRRALESFGQIGNIHGSALSRVNLAILAIEGGDAAEAIDHAQRGLALLGESGAALLRALTEVVLGEGHLLRGAVNEAEDVFRRVLTGTPPPLAHAGAERGLGRVALARGEAREARRLMQSSMEEFRKIGRAQEAARTLLFIAETHRAESEMEAARTAAREAQKQFEEIGAKRDAERAAGLVTRLG